MINSRGGSQQERDRWGENMQEGMTQGEIMSDWEKACGIRTGCAQGAEKLIPQSLSTRQGSCEVSWEQGGWW